MRNLGRVIGVILTALSLAALASGETIASWDFDESGGQAIYDHSPNGLHGYFGSTPDADAEDAARVPGLDGSFGALRMGGVGYAQVPYSALLQPAGSLTVSALIRPAADWQRRRIITNLARLGENSYSGFNFDIQGDALRLEIFSATGELNFVLAAFDFQTGDIYEVVGTWDQPSQHLEVFVDGVSLQDAIIEGSQNTTIAQIGPNSGNLFIGATSFGPSEFFLGDIDRVELSSTPMPEPGAASLIGFLILLTKPLWRTRVRG